MGYHALTFGFILGEVVRRVDGRPFGQFVHDEIGRPLGLERQLYFGIPDAEEPRVATADLGPFAARPPTPDSLIDQAIPVALRSIFNRPDVRRACIPSSNALMTARALARFYAALIGAGVDGVRLLSSQTVAAVTAPLLREPEIVFGVQAAQGLGFFLGEGMTGGRPSTFGHGGLGGNWGWADPDCGLAVGIAITCGGAPPAPALSMIAQRVREVFGILEEASG